MHVAATLGLVVSSRMSKKVAMLMSQMFSKRSLMRLVSLTEIKVLSVFELAI